MRSNFCGGFEKTAFIAPLARMGWGATKAVAGLAGKAVGAVAKPVAGAAWKGTKAAARGATRVGSGNLNKPLTFWDKASAGLTGLGAVSEGGEYMDKVRMARMRE